MITYNAHVALIYVIGKVADTIKKPVNSLLVVLWQVQQRGW